MRPRAEVRFLILACVGVGLAVCGVSVASAATIDWPVNNSGANVRFGWSGGQYETGRFGSPDVDAAGFHFNNLDFRADFPSGVFQATDDIDVRVDVTTALGGPAAPVPLIIIREWGRWGGPDESLAVVSVSTSLTGVLPTAGAGPVHGSSEWDIVYQPVDGGLGYGLWTAEYTYVPDAGNPDPEKDPWVEVIITVFNTVAIGHVDSWIEKDGMEVIMPEPASVLLLLVGFGPLMLRRSRR